jgi:hypothetical protein
VKKYYILLIYQKGLNRLNSQNFSVQLTDLNNIDISSRVAYSADFVSTYPNVNIEITAEV